LDDPRLFTARTLEAGRDHAGAARAFATARGAQKLTTSEACAWDYVEARLLSSASDERHDAQGLLAAAVAFDRASASACQLSPYPKLRAAQAYARGGNAGEAIPRARAVPEALPVRDEAKVVLAEALATTPAGRVEAVAIWRGLLAAAPRG